MSSVGVFLPYSPGQNRTDRPKLSPFFDEHSIPSPFLFASGA